jgi:diaminopimelate decarboxylase
VTGVRGVIERHFAVSRGELQVGGIPISTIADAHATPLFVYDAGVMDRQLAELRETLGDRFSVYYSVKANPNPTILRHFVTRDCGLEIASGGELHQALAAGCPPQRMVYAGPGKTDAELELVLGHKIEEIHVESAGELDRIAGIGRRLGTPAPVAVRVNPAADAEGGAMRMGGRSTPFGVDEEETMTLVGRLLDDPIFDFRGLHLFTGTQILDHMVLIRQYEKGLALARRVAARLGRPLETLDFGGGLGIPYFAEERDLDLRGLRAGVAALMAEAATDPLLAGTRFVVEPGRFLVGSSGVYVTRIVDVKVSRGKRFVVVDGGMNHHLAASGNLGQVIRRSFPVGALTRLDATDEWVADVVGPLCTPLDVLAREVRLPAARAGDLIGVFQSGAYARTASPLGFLSHASPPEVLVREGQARLIRRRGTPEDLLRDVVLA